MKFLFLCKIGLSNEGIITAIEGEAEADGLALRDAVDDMETLGEVLCDVVGVLEGLTDGEADVAIEGDVLADGL